MPRDYNTDKYIFRHHVIPETNEGLDIGITGLRFNVIRAASCAIDTGTFTSVSANTMTLNGTQVGLLGPSTLGLVATTTLSGGVASAVAGRALTSGSTGLVVTNGDGVAGNPTINLSALTGDVTTPAGSVATTLKNTGPGATGPIGSATTAPVVTIDAQGRVTALTSASLAAGAGVTGPIGSSTVTPVVTIDAQGRVSALTSATIATETGTWSAPGRLADTIYTNNSGRKRRVSVYFLYAMAGVNYAGLETPSGTSRAVAGQSTALSGGITGTAYASLYTEVPNGATYRLATLIGAINLQNWYELDE